jgi:hypothetical protein
MSKPTRNTLGARRALQTPAGEVQIYALDTLAKKYGIDLARHTGWALCSRC